MTNTTHGARTFGELMLEVAIYLGVQNFDAKRGCDILPSQRRELMLCRKVVQRGWERFVSVRPDWSFLKQTYQLVTDPTGAAPNVIGKNPAIYRMPWFFSGITLGSITYDQSGPSLCIRKMDDTELRQLKAGRTITGDPAYATFRPIQREDNQGGRPDFGWEVELYPTPSLARTILITMRAQVSRGWDVDDIHLAGEMFNRHVLAACMYEAEIEDQEDNASGDGPRGKEWQQARQEAIDLHQPTNEGSLGVLGSTINRSARGRGSTHPISSTITYNGTTL